MSWCRTGSCPNWTVSSSAAGSASGTTAGTPTSSWSHRTELARLAYTDPLTQLRNRLSLDDDLATLHAQSRRHGRSYCVAMCDIDSFKPYNDTHGHQAGDEALRHVATVLSGHVREADTVYRFGGEAFLVALPETALDAAAVPAERTRAAVEELGLPHASTEFGVVTVSVGVAAFEADHDRSVEDVLRRADGALYRAKAAGRNRVALAEHRAMQIRLGFQPRKVAPRPPFPTRVGERAGALLAASEG